MKLFQNHWRIIPKSIAINNLPAIFNCFIKYWLVSCFFVLILFSYSKFVFAENIPTPSVTVNIDQQIQLIDAEILLLKAQLALQNKELSQVLNYLAQLDMIKHILHPTMIHRIALIKQQYSYLLIEQKYITNKIDFNIDLSTVVVLMPLSGDFSKIGNSIVDGFSYKMSQKHSNHNIIYFDTNLYNSMFKLWELVRLYNPTLVIGPLKKINIIELNNLNINVPTLYLNTIDHPRPYTRAISLDRIGHLVDLVKYIDKNNTAVVLSDGSMSSINLKEQFKVLMHEYKDNLIFLEVNNSIDKAIKKSLNIEQSIARKNWLQKTIKEPLHYTQRVRQDIDLVISLLPANLAMQVTPMLQFFKLHFIEHIWLPSNLPSVREFTSKLNLFNNTTAVLPEYFINYFSENNSISLENKQLGTFYALGKLVAEVIIIMPNSGITTIPSKLGLVVLDDKYQITINPSLVWIDNGEINKRLQHTY